MKEEKVKYKYKDELSGNEADVSKSKEELYNLRLDEVTEVLITKLERAIDELDDHVITVTVKEKDIEYDEESKKPIFERVTEREEMRVEKGIIDRCALKQLVGTLKELKGKEDITESDGIVVVMSEDTKEFSV